MSREKERSKTWTQTQTEGQKTRPSTEDRDQREVTDSTGNTTQEGELLDITYIGFCTNDERRCYSNI